MLIGLALIAAVGVAAVAGAFAFAFLGDPVCIGISLVIGVLVGIGVARARIPYIGSVLHGALDGLCFLIGAAVAGMVIFGLASLGARRLGRRSLLNSDEYLPFGPDEAGDSTWLDLGDGSARVRSGSTGGISRY